MRDLLVLAILLLGIPLCLYRPWLGMLWFCIIGFGRVQDYTWGSVQSQSWSLYYSVLLVVSSFIHGYWIPYRDSTFSRLLVFFAVVLGLTNLFAIDTSLAWAGYGELWKTLAVIFFGMILIDTPKKLYYLILVITCCFVLHGNKYGLYSLLKGGTPILLGPGGKFGDNNSFGMVSAVSLPLVVYFAFHLPNVWGKWFFRWSIIPHIATIIFTYSRGAFIGMCTSIFVLILTSRHRIKALIIIPMIAAAVFTVVPDSYKARLSTVSDGLEDPLRAEEKEGPGSSNEERIQLFHAGISMFLERPWTGVGMGNYLTAHDYLAIDGRAHLPHNSLVLASAEGGVFVLILYIALFVISWLTQMRYILRSAEDPEDIPQRALFASLFAASFAFFINGLLNNHPWYDLHFFLFLLTMLADQFAQEKEERNAVWGHEGNS